MRSLCSLLVAALVCSLAGCGLDALPEDRADYAGFWTGPTISLQITPDAAVEYARNDAGSSTSISGKIARFDGDDFIVYAVFALRFDVGDRPHDEEGVQHMTVNDEDLSQ